MDLLSLVESPLSSTCDRWRSLLKASADVKRELFGKYAEESAKFFDSDHSFMWSQEYATSKQGGYLSQDSFGANGMPTFRVCVNKSFEAVALFGPALYHRNPNIVVQPKSAPHIDAMLLGAQDEQQAQQLDQMQEMQDQNQLMTAKLCAHYLNWLQLECDKKVQSRRAITEAVVKGMGVLWTEIYEPPNSKVRYPRSVYVSCDDILKDPDARYQEDVQWIARRCIHPVNLVEEKYGYEPGQLRGTMQTLHSQQLKQSKRDVKSGKRDSKSFDLIEYWEVYSKNGAGQFLKDADKEMFKSDLDLGVFGKYCYFAIADNLPFPLNIPPHLTAAYEENPSEETAQVLYEAAQWPIPFWEDEGCNNGWPFAELSFYESTDHIWPIPLTKPATGEIRFVNWIMSFLADKAAASCKTYMAVRKMAAEDIKKQLVGQNGPFSLIELSEITGKSIDDVISFLNSPTFDKALFDIVAQVLELIDRRTGLTELMYGMSSRQLRSAEEARVKNENTTIRPDEMASRVEDFLSNCAMKEMEAAIYALEADDFLPVFGEIGTQFFINNVFSDGDFYERLVRNYIYRVEAGSARKPNKSNKVEQLTQLANFALPVFQAFAMAQQIGPFNAFMSDMCDAMDLDPKNYLLEAAPQEPGQDRQAEIEMKSQEMQMKMQDQQSGMEMKRMDHQLDLEKKVADIQAQQRKLELDLQAKQLDMDLRAQQAQQEAVIRSTEAAMQIMATKEKSKSDLEMAKTKQQIAKKQAAQKKTPQAKPKKK